MLTRSKHGVVRLVRRGPQRDHGGHGRWEEEEEEEEEGYDEEDSGYRYRDEDSDEQETEEEEEGEDPELEEEEAPVDRDPTVKPVSIRTPSTTRSSAPNVVASRSTKTSSSIASVRNSQMSVSIGESAETASSNIGNVESMQSRRSGTATGSQTSSLVGFNTLSVGEENPSTLPCEL